MEQGDFTTRRARLAKLLDEARTAQHLSIRAAARLAGVAPATMQGWLNGKHLPTPALRPQFEAFVEALGIADEVVLDWRTLDPAIDSLRTVDAPYAGLRPFAVSDADVFFGRDEETNRVAQAVAALGADGGMVALVGPSGSGKSSLLAAGLVGRACAPGGLLAGRQAVIVTPDQLDDVDEADLIVVDQFEDVLVADYAEDLVDRVASLAATRAVVLGVRADAYGALSNHRQLATALEHPILLAPMTEDAMRQAIAAPALARGVEVEAGLVERLLRDLALDSTGPVPHSVLPLLSNVLLMTWSVGQGRRMTLADYELTGGLASAIESLAEGVFHALDDEQRQAARALFLRLVRIVGDSVVTVPVPKDDLPPEMGEVAEAFAGARILTLGAAGLRISHESLLGHWPRLEEWVADGRTELLLHERLRQATQLWLDNDRAVESLLLVDRLPLFGSLLADPLREAMLPPEQLEFLDASRAQFNEVVQAERRTSARLRTRGRIAAGLAIVALVLGGLATFSTVQTAGVRREAQSRQIALQSWSLRAPDRNLQAQLSLVAAHIGDTLEGRSALLGATGFDVPVRWPGEGSAVVALSPDGRVLARAGGKGTLTLWNTDELESSPGTSVTVDPQGRQLFCAAFSPVVDGRRLLAIGGPEGFRQVWEANDAPRLVADLSQGAATTYAVSFLPDGRLLAGDSDGAVDLYDLTDLGKPDKVNSVKAGGPVAGFALHAPSSTVFVAGAKDFLESWPLTDAGLEGAATKVPLDSVQGARTQAVAISPDGRSLVAGLGATAVVRWQVDPAGRATSPERLSGFDSWVNSVAFDPAGTTLAAGSSDRGVHLFDAETGKRQHVAVGPAIITSVAWVGQQLVATSTEGTLWVWSADDRELRGGGSGVFQLATDPAGDRWLAAASGGEQRMLVWDIADGMRPLPAAAPPEGVWMTSAATISADGNRLFGGTRTGEIISWELGPAGAQAPRLHRIMDEGTVFGIAEHPGRRLMSASQYTGNTTVLLEMKGDGSLEPLATLATPTPQVSGFNPDGTILQVGVGVNAVQLWDVKTPTQPRLVSTVPVSSVPLTSAFAPRSPWLAIGEDAGVVTIWDVSDPAAPTLRHRFTDPHGSVYAVLFAPDEKQVVAAGADEVIWGWDLTRPADGATFALDGRMGVTTDVRYVRGGRELAGSAMIGSVRVWQRDAAQARDMLCARRGAALTHDEWERYLPGVAQVDPCEGR